MDKLSTTVDPATGEIRLGLLGQLRLRMGAYSLPVRLWRHHKPRWLWRRLNLVGRLTLEYVERHGLEVRYGPFTGMRYPDEAVARSGYLVPKLLGTYERQLHPVFADAQRYSCFAEIGASDGFYCVGFGLLNRDARVIGFETDRVEREVSGRLAALNEVRMEIRGTAGPAELASLPATGLLLMVDIEGAERELLDPEVSPVLRTAGLLVETHTSVHADLQEVLERRFAGTHDVQEIHYDPTPVPPPAELEGLSPEESSALLSEGRLGSDLWLYLTPRAG